MASEASPQTNEARVIAQIPHLCEGINIFAEIQGGRICNQRFGIADLEYIAGFSTALAIIAFENCFRKFSIHIPNWRFQTADC